MALKDLIALGDAKLADVFKTPVYDAAKDRAKALDRLAKAEQHYKDGGKGKGIKYVRIANNVAHFNLGFEVPGFAPFVPAERGKDVFPVLREAINSGELDKQLKEWGAGGTVTVGEAPGATSGKKKRANAGQPMDPVTAYNRNVKKYGQDRANELWKTKNGNKPIPVAEDARIIPAAKGGTSGPENSANQAAPATPAKATGRKMAR